jgi:hypothetical protein
VRQATAANDALRHERLQRANTGLVHNGVRHTGAGRERGARRQHEGPRHARVAADQPDASARAFVRVPREVRYAPRNRIVICPAPRTVTSDITYGLSVDNSLVDRIVRVTVVGAAVILVQANVREHQSPHEVASHEMPPLERPEAHGDIRSNCADGSLTGRGIESTRHIECHHHGARGTQLRHAQTRRGRMLAQRPTMSRAEHAINHHALAAGGFAMRE